MKKKMAGSGIDQILKKYNQGIKLDIGCGANKQPDFVGMDFRALPGVDIVHNVELFPWPLPNDCVSVAMASHLLEHINPTAGDARIAPLIRLLIDKKVLTDKEVKQYIGESDPGPIFMRMLDEIWRVLKPGGKFMAAFPYAGSTGFWQDPTHINGINEYTLAYFDPLEAGGHLYKIYKPKPWLIAFSSWGVEGNMEIVLEKRNPDPSYEK
jgi:SAM-dependent methyltransferase